MKLIQLQLEKKREKEPWSFADSPDIYKLLSDSETGFIKYIDKNVTTLNNTKNEYEYHVEVAKERGGEFRKINVEFVIMDAFQQ